MTGALWALGGAGATASLLWLANWASGEPYVRRLARKAEREEHDRG